MPRRTSPHRLAAFLANLAETGNITLAARRTGLARTGLHKRMARDPAFAADCAAALARFDPSIAARQRHSAALTAPGDLVIVGGRHPQWRPAPAGRLTATGRSAFLTSLATTGNIRLAARHVGIAHSSIIARRETDPAFARAMDDALDMAATRARSALIAHAALTLDPEGPWHAESLANPLPPMAIADIIQLVRRLGS